ncbi:MAG: hypothetical protein ACT4QC_12505 [Planctomycetaceae bacterium]
MSSFAPMIGLFGAVSIALNGLQFVVVAAGLIVSLRYRWLSDKMWVVAVAFAALCAIAGIQFFSAILAMLWMMEFAKSGSFTAGAMNTSSSITMGLAGGASGLVMFAHPFAWMGLVVGLTLVWRDLSGRLSGLRELLAERRQESPRASA